MPRTATNLHGCQKQLKPARTAPTRRARRAQPVHAGPIKPTPEKRPRLTDAPAPDCTQPGSVLQPHKLALTCAFPPELQHAAVIALSMHVNDELTLSEAKNVDQRAERRLRRRIEREIHSNTR